MRYRNHKGVKVSEIGVGCYSLSGVGMTYPIKPNLTPEYIKEACERSLQIWEPFRKVSLPQ